LDIRKHIKELLFTHDCVVIPGFGGFVTSYQPSEIQRFKNVIYPPSKSILFNRRLQANDGVLVHHVSEQEKIDYRTAEQKVRQLADAWNRLIDSKGMLMFPDIGKLYINSSGALVFLPELRKNYLTDTFGLKPIAYHLHSETSSPKTIYMSPKTKPAENDAADSGKTKSSRKLVPLAVAAILVLLLLIPQLFLQDFLPEKLRVQQLNLMPFIKGKTGTAEKVMHEKKESLPPASEPFSGDTAAENAFDSSVDTTTSASAETGEAEEETETTMPAETTKETKSQQPISGTGNFYVVLGSYDFISDAIRMKKQLDSEHGKTFEVFTAPDDSYVVGLRSGESRQEAESALAAFKTENPDAKVMQRE